MDSAKIIAMLTKPSEALHYGRKGMKWYQHIFGRDQTEGYAKGTATKGAGKKGRGMPKPRPGPEKPSSKSGGSGGASSATRQKTASLATKVKEQLSDKPGALIEKPTEAAKKAEKMQTATAKELLQRQGEYTNQELINMRIRKTEIAKIQAEYEAGTLMGKTKKFLASDAGKMATSIAVQFVGHSLAAKSENPTISILAQMTAQTAAAKAGVKGPDVAGLMEALRKKSPGEQEDINNRIALDMALTQAREQKKFTDDTVEYHRIREQITSVSDEIKARAAGTWSQQQAVQEHEKRLQQAESARQIQKEMTRRTLAEREAEEKAKQAQAEAEEKAKAQQQAAQEAQKAQAEAQRRAQAQQQAAQQTQKAQEAAQRTAKIQQQAAQEAQKAQAEAQRRAQAQQEAQRQNDAQREEQRRQMQVQAERYKQIQEAANQRSQQIAQETAAQRQQVDDLTKKKKKD